MKNFLFGMILALTLGSAALAQTGRQPDQPADSDEHHRLRLSSTTFPMADSHRCAWF